jgi:hypothetical protein
MSTPSLEPRCQRRPTLPEIAGLIAGILALAIALAPNLASHTRRDAASGGPNDAAHLEAGTAPAPPLDPARRPIAGGLAARDRCGPKAFTGGIPAPGAFCPLPPREQEPEETHFVNLSFSWPPF